MDDNMSYFVVINDHWFPKLDLSRNTTDLNQEKFCFSQNVEKFKVFLGKSRKALKSK